MSLEKFTNVQIFGQRVHILLIFLMHFARLQNFPNLCWFLTALTMSESFCFIIISPEYYCSYSLLIYLTNCITLILYSNVSDCRWDKMLSRFVSHFYFLRCELNVLSISLEITFIFNFWNYGLFSFLLAWIPFIT